MFFYKILYVNSNRCVQYMKNPHIVKKLVTNPGLQKKFQILTNKIVMGVNSFIYSQNKYLVVGPNNVFKTYDQSFCISL